MELINEVIWERVIEQRLRLESNISENQLRIMLRRSTTEAISIMIIAEIKREYERSIYGIY